MIVPLCNDRVQKDIKNYVQKPIYNPDKPLQNSHRRAFQINNLIFLDLLILRSQSS